MAVKRDIPFLTLEEWWKIWCDSGRWAERGCRRGQYVMSRPGDVGPYAAWNVRICTAAENAADRRGRKKKPYIHQKAIGHTRGQKDTQRNCRKCGEPLEKPIRSRT